MFCKTNMRIIFFALIVQLLSCTTNFEEKKWTPEIQREIEKTKQNSIILVTAKWDINSQKNYKVIKSLSKLLHEKNFTLFVADCTTPNEPIKKLLQENGVSGIPLTLIYVKGKKYILPELYSQKYLEKMIKEPE